MRNIDIPQIFLRARDELKAHYQGYDGSLRRLALDIFKWYNVERHIGLSLREVGYVAACSHNTVRDALIEEYGIEDYQKMAKKKFRI